LSKTLGVDVATAIPASPSSVSSTLFAIGDAFLEVVSPQQEARPPAVCSTSRR
jgi:hypothetical protein